MLSLISAFAVLAQIVSSKPDTTIMDFMFTVLILHTADL
jgi:hypothetical protein